MKNFGALFEEFQLPNGAILKNRLLMAPMTIKDSYENGMVSDHEIDYYQLRAGEIGAIITAATYVDQLGKVFESGPAIDDDSKISGLKKLAEVIHAKGSKAIVQLFHGGRMVLPHTIGGAAPVSASAVKAPRENTVVPRALTEEEILDLIQSFYDAAVRAVQAGFDGIELHGANTYLLQQFLSPHSNRRKDEWGGSLEKRMRFPLAVVESVKQAVQKFSDKPFIIGYRLSPEETEEPGLTLNDTLQFIDRLIDTNIDYVHISLTDAKRTTMRKDEDYQGIILDLIRKHVHHRIPVIGVGGVTTPEDALNLLHEGIPLVALGRELILDPNWAEKVKTDDFDAIRYNLSIHDKNMLKLSDSTWAFLTATKGWLRLSNPPAN